MAYTSVIPVRRLDRTVDYVQNKAKTTPKSLEEAVDYAANRRTIITMSAAFCILSGKKKLSVILEPENTRKHILAPNDIPYSAVVHVAIAFRFWMERNSAKGKHIVPMQ